MSAPKSPYRQLQAQAKARGIPANQSGAVLEALLDEAAEGGGGFASASPALAKPVVGRQTGLRSRGRGNDRDRPVADDDTTPQPPPDPAPKPMSSDDRWAIAVLLLLYTIQGIPMGLASSVPFILQTKTDASYADQAVFAFCTWPFSLKLLWAPIVDSLYLDRVGRRKTWLIPVQTAAAIAMLYAGRHMDTLLGGGDAAGGGKGTPDVPSLALVFFGIYFLMATQDIAVDGWALTMLSKENVEMGSTCNTIGQQFGYFTSFVGFLALNDPGTCNSWVRPFVGLAADPGPMMTLGGFLGGFGWLTLGTTVLVALFKTERPDNETHSIGAAYAELWQAAKQPAALQLFSVLLTYRLGFAVADNLTHLKMVEYGFPKEEIAMVTPLLLPVGLLVPIVARYYMVHPLRVWLRAYPVRIAIGVLDVWIIYQTKHDKNLAFRGFVGLSVVWTVVSTLMFSAQMEYFAREAVQNPAMGGSYMTLLNTVANLGGSWPQPTVLWLVQHFTVTEQPCLRPDKSDCIQRDGFYPLAVGSTILGVCWLLAMGPMIHRMADQSEAEAARQARQGADNAPNNANDNDNNGTGGPIRPKKAQPKSD